MAVSTSDKPVEDEARSESKANRDDSNLETSKIAPDSCYYSDLALADWYLCPVSYESEDGEEGVNLISDWVVFDGSSSTLDEDFPVTIASLPVGTVLSVKDKQVIVEGKGEYNLLSIGSFLWISETREPLGYVDEVLGTVEKPCFSVRFESESQVPDGISLGTQVSLIVAESVRCEKIGCDETDGNELSDGGKDAECENKEMGSDEKADNGGDDNKVLDLERSKSLEAQQPLPSPNPSHSETSPVMPQASPETCVVVTPLQPLPFKFTAPGKPETNQPSRYQPPMVKQIGLIPSPVPTQAPEGMMPARYPQQHFRNGPIGLHQRYQSGTSWRAIKSGPLPVHYIPPGAQPTPYQRVNAGLSSDRGRRSNHRGGGSGFLGRGRELPRPR